MCALSATLAIAAVLVSGAIPAFAAEGGLGGSLKSGLEAAAPAELKTGETNLPKLIGNIIGGVMSLIGAILFVYLLYGGFIYMTAGGDTQKVKAATDIIKNAVIGMVLIVAAYAIANFIIGSLSNATVASGGTESGNPPTP